MSRRVASIELLPLYRASRERGSGGGRGVRASRALSDQHWSPNPGPESQSGSGTCATLPRAMPPTALPTAPPSVRLCAAAPLLFSALLAVACSPTPAPRTPTEARVTSSPILAPASSPAAPEDDAAVPVSLKDPSWGDRRALVTLVVFGDLECPFTGKVLPTLHKLEDKYGPADLRIVWKDLPLPFHPGHAPLRRRRRPCFRSAAPTRSGGSGSRR